MAPGGLMSLLWTAPRRGFSMVSGRLIWLPMRRSLVLTDESARHPFRASLPPHVREMRHEDAEPRAPWRALLQQGARDMRGFLSAYVACLAAVFAFLI